MASHRAIKARCARTNLSRRVLEYESELNLSAFWQRAAGNFMISGGREADQHQRTRVLSSGISALRRQSRCPMLVLNSAPALEQELMGKARQNQLRICPITSTTRNYDVFYGMPAPSIRELFQSISRMQGDLSVGALGNYVDAFLAIVEHDTSLSLSSMSHYATYTDADLRQYGAQIGISQIRLNTLTYQTEAGETMRRIIGDIYAAFAHITTRDCDTHCSILSGATGDAIVLMDDRSANADIFHLCLAKELELAMNRFPSMVWILNDVNLNRRSADFQELLSLAKTSRGNVRVGISTQDGYAWAQGCDRPEDMLSNIQTWVLLNEGSQTAANIAPLLNQFGTYEYHYPAITGGDPDSLTDIWFSQNWHEEIQPDTPRVRFQDFHPYGVLVAGHAGEIVELYAGLSSQG